MQCYNLLSPNPFSCCSALGYQWSSTHFFDKNRSRWLDRQSAGSKPRRVRSLCFAIITMFWGHSNTPWYRHAGYVSCCGYTCVCVHGWPNVWYVYVCVCAHVCLAMVCVFAWAHTVDQMYQVSLQSIPNCGNSSLHLFWDTDQSTNSWLLWLSRHTYKLFWHNGSFTETLNKILYSYM